ncbi:serine/threonine-protein kinase [uncultured Spirosoma sp.]|uniref:serine/threonine-protein kinase n=1 Tax=uncultured Spirosoma sp. TaxID=278208 RepID=UPI00258C408B|nr:serine/threonine-protein kinase [uncultured Spirosoma sp.]
MRPGDKLLNYTITRRIKAGGMGVVFEGEQTWGSRRKVAIKQLLENLRDDDIIRRRFIREAEILEMLEDPRIVRILGFDPDQDAFVMEFVEGNTLSDQLKANPTLFRQPGVLVEFMTNLLDAFSYAHNATLTIEGRTERGIVHRDIKPSNIIVQPDGSPKILDFGISRIASFQSTLTDPKLQMGSVPYMSPEQIVTPTDVDWRSDIYSLGVTLWETQTGRSPYPRVTTHEVVVEVQRQIRFDPLPPLVQLVPADTANDRQFFRQLDQIITKATAKERDHRYQHCEEMKLAIQQAFNTWLGNGTDKQPVENEATRVRPASEPILASALSAPAAKSIWPHASLAESAVTEQQPVESAQSVPDVVAANRQQPAYGTNAGTTGASKKPGRTAAYGLAAALLMAGGIWWWQHKPAQPTPKAATANLSPPATSVLASDATLDELAKADSCLDVATNYYYGRGGLPNDYGKALRGFEQAAKLGNSDAQNRLGTMHQYGQGTAQQYGQALYWYRASAGQGNPEGQKNLGVMYYLGLGVPKAYPEALKWFEAAAGQGNAEGMTNLGVMYEHGTGVAVDNAVALKWYTRAANQHYARAQYYVGNLYALGKGVPQSTAKAVQWYQLAARQGDTNAQRELHRLQQSW